MNIHYLTKSNSEKLLKETTNVKHLLIELLMLDAGLRVSETITIKFNQFDFKRKELKIKSLKKRDTENYRIIPLSNRLYQALADYIYTVKDIKGNNYIFPSKTKNTHLSRDAVNKFLSRKNQKIGIPNLHPHALRHTFATEHLSNGTPLENIKTMLGHKSYDTTLIYAHIPQEILKQNVQKVTETDQNKLIALAKKWIGIKPKNQLINLNFNKNTLSIGRNEVIKQIETLETKKVNTLILGDIGTGKTHLLEQIQPTKKILKLDDTDNIKKSLANMLLYLYKNDKETVYELIYSDLPYNKALVKINRESIKNICTEIKKTVQPKEYTLIIDRVDRITPKAVQALEELKDTFTIIASAREISMNKSSFLWNFEIIKLKPLERKYALDLIERLSYDLEIENKELFRNHIFEQSNGNPRVIFEIIDRYRKEPFITNEVVREIRHTASIKEIDMTFLVVACLASLAIFRYLALETGESSMKMIGGTSMVLLIVSRQFMGNNKRKFI